jgi:hypothetical protein
MPKRFTDTEKWRKGFVRSLEAPYKLLWLYILDECDHAGIWHVELDVACLRIGFNITMEDAILNLEKHIHPFDGDEKWFIVDFISFQYGELNESNRVHQSVIRQLRKYGLWKVYTSSLEGAKDKDKDKDKDKGKGKDKGKEKAVRKKATALPSDWKFSESHLTLSMELGVDAVAQSEKFIDYAIANGKTYKDWDAAFRNWLRNASEYAGKNSVCGNGSKQKLPPAMALQQRNRELLDRIEREEER